MLQIASLKPEVREAFIASLTNSEAEALFYSWEANARPSQIAPLGDWRYWLILAGRGFGKTRTIAEFARSRAEAGIGPGVIVGRSAGDLRDIIIEGPAGIIAVSPRWFRPHYEPSKQRLTWPNGVVANLRSADEPDGLRGIQGAWAICDELAAWRFLTETWSNLELGLRLGDNPQIAIATTPRPIKLLRDLLANKRAVVTRGKTLDNAANLAGSFVQAMLDAYAGTRLGRQELDGAILEDVPGALWQRSNIDASRVRILPENLEEVVVAVDPPITTGEKADECGIIVAGRQGDWKTGHMYVIADLSTRGQSPLEWGSVAVKAYETYKANRIVAESNQGGEMVRTVIAQAANAIGLSPSVKLVHATRGKARRAEPVSALFEQSRGHILGSLAALEDQLCLMTTDFDSARAGFSPDRADAMVWAGYSLFIEPRSTPWVG